MNLGRIYYAPSSLRKYYKSVSRGLLDKKYKDNTNNPHNIIKWRHVFHL